MRISPPMTLARMEAAQLSQLTARVGAHQSSPTSRPVEQPGEIRDEMAARRPSRHALDIRV